MTKDFSYLEEKTTSKKTYGLMLLSGSCLMAILLGSYFYLNWHDEVTIFTTEREAYIQGMLFALGLIAVLISIVILIHKVGGVAIRDIPDYWKWVKEDGKKK
jgi:hypothetical protein